MANGHDANPIPSFPNFYVRRNKQGLLGIHKEYKWRGIGQRRRVDYLRARDHKAALASSPKGPDFGVLVLVPWFYIFITATDSITSSLISFPSKYPLLGPHIARETDLGTTMAVHPTTILTPFIALLSLYAAQKSYIAITNLQRYEERTEKAAKHLDKAEHDLYKTRVTQASGAAAIRTHCYCSPLYVFALGNILAWAMRPP